MKIIRTQARQHTQSIYQTLKNINANLDHHESDLYVECTPQTIEATKSQPNREFFRGTDGKTWIELPFAHKPFWDSKT